MPSADTPQNVAARFCATLVDEWIELGVRDAVVAPGSRSTALALALAERTELRLHLFHDERAASFAALGIGLLGTPAILLCTSGTAAAHFHAAVVEAHQSAVPMIVCTADRPPELRDVGAPQTIDQTKLYGSVVRWFHDPGVASIEAERSWRPLAAHALAAATGHWPGPVHLNLPFREPLLGDAGQLPPRSDEVPTTSQEAVRTVPTDAAISRLVSALRSGRALIVAGRGCGTADVLHDFAAALRIPVLADARSGVRHHDDVAIAAADHILRSARFATDHRPDIVLRIGEPPVSKVVNQWLAALGVEQISITGVPAWFDPDGVVTTRVVADPDDVLRRVLQQSHSPDVDDSWLRDWIDAEAVAQRHIANVLGKSDLSEPSVARSIGSFLPAGATLVVSSSMPIRDVEWFGVVPRGLSVLSNRGANGIDGVIATSIGVALASGAPTGLLIGDVAFLHDSSALVGLIHRNVDLRIVLIDNDGGGIFSFLPQAAQLTDNRFEQLFGTPHGVDLLSLAAAHGIPAHTVKSLDQLESALAGRGPYVVRVETDRRENVAMHARLNEI